MDAKQTTADALAELRRESQSIFNRIHSIAQDATFVRHVHAHYPDLPLLPNMRCGAWYTDPKLTPDAPRAYFKSTDGHANNWSFSLRRPNLHILSLIVEHGGLVLVDSTRAGKRIPDALSKTAPIWCSVVSRAILKRSSKPHPRTWDIALYTPPGSVSPQEHRQIEDRLDKWASELSASSYTLPKLEYPLRPIWITPATSVFPTFPAPDRAFYPVICVSASKQITDCTERRALGFAYIQGSGDDHELWGMGLTPDLYWRHCDKILAAGPSDLPDLVQSLVEASSQSDDATHTDQSLCGTPIQHVLGRISICTVASLRRPNLLQTYRDTAFVCCTTPLNGDPGHLTSTAEAEAVSPSKASRMLNIRTPEGKKGQHHFLTVVLPHSMPFIRHHLEHQRAVCIACNTGTDVGVGVAVAALAMLFHPDGSFCAQGNARDEISKHVLKIRLQWIISSYPQANPSRTTLKRVNDYFLSPFSNPSILGTPGRPEHASNLGERDTPSISTSQVI